MSRLVFLALALALAGCASAKKGVAVTGTLVKGEKPYTFSAQGLPPGDPGLRLGFSSLGSGGVMGDTSFAVYSPADGTFKVNGPDGQGLPPGKYRISVAKAAMGRPDELKDAFSRDKSPLTVDIPASSPVNIEVNLDKKTATIK
jgi:hypothetical protein